MKQLNICTDQRSKTLRKSRVLAACLVCIYIIAGLAQAKPIVVAQSHSHDHSHEHSHVHLHVPTSYPSVREQLIFYKEDDMKVYYGGPITNENLGIKWMMPVVFKGDNNNIRSVYEIGFINCTPEDAEGAKLFYTKVSDLNIKFQNEMSDDYKSFANLINGTYQNGKYIVVRETDTSLVAFPDIFVADLYEQKDPADLDKIVDFMARKYKTHRSITPVYASVTKPKVQSEDDNLIIYAAEHIRLKLDGKQQDFNVVKLIDKKNVWKLYYVIARNKIKQKDLKKNVLVRIDSGCVSGQIYADSACDCIEQLYDALKIMAKENKENSIVIHIPAHDGRGFGTAPKAETEIYKQGGKGMINTTMPLDTIAAAKLLYQVNDETYDIRSYEGVGAILKNFGYAEVTLLTDNKLKIQALEKHGIKVTRRKTDSQKEECKVHSIAKKKSPQYFED
jgi:GTP cyclohydrolase II